MTDPGLVDHAEDERARREERAHRRDVERGEDERARALVDAEALLTEVSRLLRDDGYFVASFDYWPEKLDTTGTRAFGMDWRIFSRDEVDAFVEQARAFELEPIGPLRVDAKEPVIQWSGRRYSFAWLALRRVPRQRQSGI